MFASKKLFWARDLIFIFQSVNLSCFFLDICGFLIIFLSFFNCLTSPSGGPLHQLHCLIFTSSFLPTIAVGKSKMSFFWSFPS